MKSSNDDGMSAANKFAIASAGNSIAQESASRAANAAAGIRVPQPQDPQSRVDIPSYKRGGTVRRTGLAMLHKGERVIPVNRLKGARGQRARRSR